MSSKIVSVCMYLNRTDIIKDVKIKIRFFLTGDDKGTPWVLWGAHGCLYAPMVLILYNYIVYIIYTMYRV